MSSRSLRPSGRKIVAAVATASLGLAGLGLAATPVAADTIETVTDDCGRLAGGDRFGTAAAIADAYDAESPVDTVIIANGFNFPDALAASGLARELNAPVLLINGGSNEIPDGTQVALDQLDPANVVIVGGTDAVPQAIEDTLDADHNVDRVAGIDRYQTARDIALEIPAGEVGEVDGLKTAIIATGNNYPDALAGGPVAYHGDGTNPMPILLTDGATVPAPTSTALDAHGIEQVIILGGTTAVPTAAEVALEEQTGNDAIRLGGNLREDTAQLIAEFTVSELGFAPDAVLLADGRERFPSPDALSGGPLGGLEMAPILLVNPGMPTQTEDFITDNADAIEQVIALGGTVVVSAEVLNAGCEAGGVPVPGGDTIGPNEVFSDAAPELVQVTELEEDVLAFEFDETITGQALRFTETSPGSEVRQYYGFRLYDPQGNVSYPFEARIEGDTVIARFFANATDTASLATVRFNAVEDSTGIPNIEGEYPLLPPEVTSSTAPFSPQLTMVDNYRTADVIIGGTAELLIDYTFNSATAVAELGLEANDFYLVGDFGAEYQADAMQNTTVTVPATGTDPGESVVTVAFSLNPQDVPESQLARGYVVAGLADTDNQEASGQDEDGDLIVEADTDAEGFVLSEPFESGDDITDTPDLQSVTRVNATTYRFQFDEAVSDAELTPTGFFVFDADGDMTEASAVARSALAADEASVVIATILDTNDVDGDTNTTEGLPISGENTPVDAFVADGAVRATDSTDDENSGYNRPDEAILTLPATEATQPPPGITAKPDLQSITRDQNVVTENFSVTYTFDQAICGVDLTNVAFDLYDENGVQFRVDGVTTTTGVTCSGNSITFSLDDGFSELSNEQIAAAVTGGVEDIDDAPELSADITVTEAQTGITEG